MNGLRAFSMMILRKSLVMIRNESLNLVWFRMMRQQSG